MTRPPPWTMMRATQTAAPWPHDPACLDADPKLFDSALIGDHRRAVEWCKFCPVIDLCDTLAHTIAAEVAVDAASPNGT
ncbi:MAG: WhiB family transcriptional regulator, partial [Actinomycetota bacterium]|nr:WhiB family transcriptional regulator [Actinomycetota bacterium]